LKISIRSKYALRFLLDLAEHSNGQYVPLQDTVDRQGISKQYLEQVIFLLNTAKMLRAKRGVYGGYRLASDPSTFTVGSVLRVTDIPLTGPVECGNGGNECSNPESCKTFPMWCELEHIINSYLDSITLQDLIDQRKWSGRGKSGAAKKKCDAAR